MYFYHYVIVGYFDGPNIHMNRRYDMSDYHTWDTEKLNYNLGNN
jgi:hypothetical protein